MAPDELHATLKVTGITADLDGTPIHWNLPTGKFQIPPEGELGVTISPALARNPDITHHTLEVDGHAVPYIDVTDITEQWKVAPPSDPAEWADEAHRLRKHAVERGERIFSLTLDNRFGHTVTESELLQWGWFLAHAMAVSAGYTSHGHNGRRINRHGPSRK